MTAPAVSSSTRRLMRLRLLVLLVTAALVPLSEARSQVGLSVLAGYSTASDSGEATLDTKGLTVGLQLGIPFAPLAIRAEATHWGTDINLDQVTYMGSALLQIRFPLLQPYLIAGYGNFAMSESTAVTGWQAGAGARVGLGRLGAYLEIRRHDAVDRTVTTLGVTF